MEQLKVKVFCSPFVKHYHLRQTGGVAPHPISFIRSLPGTGRRPLEETKAVGLGVWKAK